MFKHKAELIGDIVNFGLTKNVLRCQNKIVSPTFLPLNYIGFHGNEEKGQERDYRRLVFGLTQS